MIYFFKLTCRMRTPVKGSIGSGQKQTAMPSDLQLALDNGIDQFDYGIKHSL